MTTIEELLKLMYTLSSDKKSKDSVTLENTIETWKRIANKDSFLLLNFSSESEKEKFLSEWCADNPYNNI